ncbi:hypothetical protein PsorP6_014716 [Peronosclerospora sorghi]|uniref:Uncharacterized protein n=1 Tax=Peronosclerospora sorghi TaxID=230839 RepID=A0ACC0VT68_9STRA|nr:hypothetical protein PsorP6_014716 [Peronosclerospora sorghi]
MKNAAISWNPFDTSLTKAEDVSYVSYISYVSSPFIPRCLRNPETTTNLSSNALQALEVSSRQYNIRDKLSEAIVLTNPVCLVGECIPFSSNQIWHLTSTWNP